MMQGLLFIFALLLFLPVHFMTLGAQCGLFIGNDTILCMGGGPVSLNAAAGFGSYLWNTGSTATSIVAPGPGIYWCEVTCATGNLVTNGHFNSGNTGFSSSYTHTPSLLSEGTYFVGPNAAATHPAFVGFGQGGSGNFMIVNGSGVAGSNVWCQTITVVPNTTYNFSTWVCSVHPASPAQLQFSINGLSIGPVFVAPNVQNLWIQFSTTWNSGSNTTATICILNQNTALGGNDFGIDNISFSTVFTEKDTLIIGLASPLPVNLGPDTVICDGSQLVLDAGFPGNTYLWHNGATTQSIIVNTTALAWVQVTDTNGCMYSDSILVTYDNKPAVNLGPDSINCGNQAIALFADPLGLYSGSAFLWQNGSTATSHTAAVSGLYWVRITKPSGCNASDSINIIITQKPLVDLGPDTVICDGVFMILDAGIPGLSYLWFNGSLTQTISLNSTSTAWVIATDANGCSDTDSILITYDAPPVVNLGPDTTHCLTQPFILFADPLNQYPGAAFQWQNGSSTSNLMASVSGLFWVQVTKTNGCMNRDSINVIISQRPVVNLGPDQILCVPGTLLLNASATGANAFTWQDGSTQQTLMIALPGTYSVTAGSQFCGTDSDSIFITADSVQPFTLGNDTSVCAGETVAFSLPGIGVSFWHDGSAKSVRIFGVEGFLWVQSNQFCGSYRDSVFLTIEPIPQINLGPDREWCPVDTIILLARGNFSSWQWNDFTADSFLVVSQTGTYSVEVIGLNGCKGRDEADVKEGACPVGLFVPNAFSPNGDGLNDYFFPVEKDLYVTAILVFDRWGKLIFQGNRSSDYWDGRFDGKECSEGAFAWVIVYQDYFGASGIMRGSLTLLR